MYATKRLILRNWREADTPGFIKMNQDPQVMEFFPTVLSSEESISLIEKIKSKFKVQGFGFYACELKESQELIGFVGLNIPDFKASFTPCVEVGWRIAYKFWGQGLAVEAAQKCLDIGFNEYNLNEIASFTALVNKRSERVMQKLGMTRDSAHDFIHLKLDPHHPLAKHILYRLRREDFIKHLKDKVQP
ncbi:MAG: acetyltransferase [Burkholderiales bacterium]|jgi:3-dehydroquinate dehydratase/shikimate dehydrogenase|nr:acetyltransferase [Burkholderiales bacterium]